MAEGSDGKTETRNLQIDTIGGSLVERETTSVRSEGEIGSGNRAITSVYRSSGGEFRTPTMETITTMGSDPEELGGSLSKHYKERSWPRITSLNAGKSIIP